MASILLTAPAVEPLSLADAKAFLRVETGDDDEVISALISGSRIRMEAQTRRALITQGWRISVDAYVWKVVVWDRVLGLRSTPALNGDVAQWAMIVLTAYFGGRSLEKVARILGRK